MAGNHSHPGARTFCAGSSHEYGIRAVLRWADAPLCNARGSAAGDRARSAGRATGSPLRPGGSLCAPGCLAGRQHRRLIASSAVHTGKAEIIVTIGLGALLAADRPLPLAFVVGLAILLGLFHGILNGYELAKGPSSGLVTVGAAVGLFVLVSLLAGQAASVRMRWARVAVRVAGSWIAAIGLLMLGWATRGTA